MQGTLQEGIEDLTGVEEMQYDGEYLQNLVFNHFN
jgi:hypothetical protein